MTLKSIHGQNVISSTKAPPANELGRIRTGDPRRVKTEGRVWCGFGAGKITHPQ